VISLAASMLLCDLTAVQQRTPQGCMLRKHFVTRFLSHLGCYNDVTSLLQGSVVQRSVPGPGCCLEVEASRTADNFNTQFYTQLLNCRCVGLILKGGRP
jgi:hypothetical protein